MRANQLAIGAGVSVVALVVSLTGQSRTPQGADAKRFLGSWRLVSITQQNGEVNPISGAHPTGALYYDATGHMGLQVMPDRVLRRAYAGVEPTPGEAQASLRGYAADFGTYSIDEHTHTVTHHREGNINPGALGNVLRRYEFLEGDRVALMPLDGQNRIIWKRIK